MRFDVRLDVKQAMRRRALGGALILALVAAPGAIRAQEEDPGLHNEAGLGALAALGTLVYGPVKIAYATAGLLFGGVAWGLAGGDGEVLTAVVTPSVRGDYVVTPEHVRMERPVEFFGRYPAYRSVQRASADDPAERSTDDSVASAPVESWGGSVVEEDY